MSKKILSVKFPEKRKAPGSNKLKVISKGMKTPIATVHFCALATPTFFSGSTIPRYKVQLAFDPKNSEHKGFLKSLSLLAEELDAKFILKENQDGLLLVTFRSREMPKVKMLEYGKKRATSVELAHDMPKGFKCSVKFDLKKYQELHTKEFAFTFPPIEVVFHLDESTKDLIEVSNGDCEDTGD